MDEQHEAKTIEQDEQHNMEIWRQEVNTNLRENTKTLAEISATIGKLPTRTEIEQMIAQKVSAELFHTEIAALRSEHKNDIDALKGDIAAIRNGPGKVREWLAFITGTGVGCLSLILSALSLILFFLVATHVIH